MKKIFYIFCFLLIPTVALGVSSHQLPTSYNESTYGDGTRDYSSLAAWEADTDIDLVTAGAGEVLTCYDDDASYNDSILIEEATTSADYYRVIRAADGQRGTPTSGVRFEYSSAIGTYTIYSLEDYFQAHNIAANAVTTGNDYAGIGITLAGHGSKIIGCTAYDCVGSGTKFSCGFSVGAADNVNRTLYIINSFVDNCTGGSSPDHRAGIRIINTIAGSTLTAYVYNATVTNCDRAGISIRATSNATTIAYIKNCIAQDNAGSQIIKTNGGGSETINPTTNAIFAVTFAADGYHLDATDITAINQGTDLSSDSVFAFDDDIDGETREPGAWDIGCDEYLEFIPPTSTPRVFSIMF